VLEQEADEHVVEGLAREGQGQDVGLLEAHVAEARGLDLRLRRGQRIRRDIDGHEARFRAVARERDGLSADAAAGLEHQAAGWIARVRVQQVGHRVGLVLQAHVRAPVVAVDVFATRHLSTAASAALISCSRERTPLMTNIPPFCQCVRTSASGFAVRTSSTLTCSTTSVPPSTSEGMPIRNTGPSSRTTMTSNRSAWMRDADASS